MKQVISPAILWACLQMPVVVAQAEQPPAQPVAVPLPDPMPAPTQAQLRERVAYWMRKLRYSGNTAETDRVRTNLIALGKQAVPLIVEAAQNDFGTKPLPFHLWNVCLTLGRMNDDRAVPYLLQRLEPVPAADLKQRPEWNYMRAFAALSLGKISDPARAAVPALRKYLNDEKEIPFVRRVCALALGTLQDQGSIPALAAQLNDPKADGTMRGGAAMALGIIKSETSVDALLAYLLLDTKVRDAFADRMAVQALGTQRSERAVDPLRKLLAGISDPALQASAALVLGWIGKRDAAADVQKLMEDPTADTYVSCCAAVALLGLGKEVAGSAYLRSVAQSDPRKSALGLVAYATVALGECFADENVKALYQVIRETKYPVVAMNGINALGHRKDPRMVPFLIERFGDYNGATHQYLRGEIIRALMAFPTQEAIRSLCIRALTDHDDYVQAKSAIALARYPGADTEAALVGCLDDYSADVRGEAALTLGLLKSARAVDALRKLLLDDSDWVRLRAHKALENILKFGKDEFQQTAGIQDLVDQRVKAVGASLSEEMERLYSEGYARVLELDTVK